MIVVLDCSATEVVLDCSAQPVSEATQVVPELSPGSTGVSERMVQCTSFHYHILIYLIYMYVSDILGNVNYPNR